MVGGFFKKNGGRKIDVTDIRAREKFANVNNILGRTTKPPVNPIDINRKVSLRADDILKDFKAKKLGRK